jgi:predicted transcriptional regulator
MSNKDLVIEAVRGMPEEATIDQISEEIAVLAAIRRGQEAVRAGDIITHDEVEERLSKWISK